jgi:DUF1680 family protein
MNRIVNKFFNIFFLWLFSSYVQAQIVFLPKDAKYIINDGTGWAAPDFDDSNWGTRKLGTSLYDTTVRKNIFIWYRIKVFVPSGLKKNIEPGKGLWLSLGKIDDADLTYFNGKLVGKTGEMPPSYVGRAMDKRVYNIPSELVRWDKDNLIAIRVFSPDPWVGMYEGPYKLGPLDWSDSIAVEHAIAPTQQNSFATTIKLINNGNSPFEGTIRYRVTDSKNNELFSETKPIIVQPKKGAESQADFSSYRPVKDKIVNVGFTVTEKVTGISVNKEELYLADKNIDIPVGMEPVPLVANVIKDAYTSIRFQDQQQKGYIGKRMNQNLTERLLKLDEAGTLDGYLSRPGHHPWAGEHIGKYLETASNVWKYTGDESLKKQMDRLMYQLINSQLPDGYLGTYIPDEYWTSWDVWSHKYNLYGLLAYYEATGYKPALEVCVRIGDLLCRTFGNNPGQLDIILAGTHVGMAATSVLDPMVELYKYTGDKKYLNFCYYIMDAWEQKHGPKIMSALLNTGKVTAVGNGKAYEMLSNFVGLVNLYRVTGDEKLLKAVLLGWKDIVANKLYITGTTSSHEHFQGDGDLPAARENSMGEGCVTTTWVQFNHQLLMATGDLKYFDEIEKAVYNHLLAAENPQTGCVSYYTPLMDAKPFTCHITCCQSSVPRGIAMVPYFSFGNLKNLPTVMMYESAVYKEAIKGTRGENIELDLHVASSFPENGNAVITVFPARAASFSVALRVPEWCNSFSATVGGKVYKGIKDQQIVINRSWKSGDRINVSFDLPLTVLYGGKSYPGQIAFKRGPQVLALDSALNVAVPENFSFGTGQKIVTSLPKVAKSPDALPVNWIGQQAFSIGVADKANASRKMEWLLVPFADASQTGGAMKVWLPLEVKK